MAIDYSDIKEIVQEHMGAQPYKCKCAECGEALEFERDEIEADGDLHISVHPCGCVKGGE